MSLENAFLNFKNEKRREFVVRRFMKIGRLLAFLFVISILVGESVFGSLNQSSIKIQHVSMTVSPTATGTFPFLKHVTAACSNGNHGKFYLYSDPSHVMLESSLEILSALNPEKFREISIIKAFPSKNIKKYRLNDLMALNNKEFIALSTSADRLFVFSNKGELVSQLEGDFSSARNILMTPYQNDQFFLVNKDKGKLYLMNTSGKTIFSTPVAIIVNGGKINASQFEDIEYTNGFLYILTSSGYILECTPKEKFIRSILNGIPSNKVISFAIDSMGNVFIAYHPSTGSKVQKNTLKLSVITTEGAKAVMKEFYEKFLSKNLYYLKIIAYRGFLILIEDEKYSIFPTRSLLMQQ